MKQYAAAFTLDEASTLSMPEAPVNGTNISLDQVLHQGTGKTDEATMRYLNAQLTDEIREYLVCHEKRYTDMWIRQPFCPMVSFNEAVRQYPFSVITVLVRAFPSTLKIETHHECLSVRYAKPTKGAAWEFSMNRDKIIHRGCGETAKQAFDLFLQSLDESNQTIGVNEQGDILVGHTIQFTMCKTAGSWKPVRGSNYRGKRSFNQLPPLFREAVWMWLQTQETYPGLLDQITIDMVMA